MKSRVSPLCYDIYCKNDKIPFLLLFLSFILGIMIGWFGFDYILNIMDFPQIELNGFRIHHIYVGIGIVIILLPIIFIFILKNKYIKWIIFFNIILGFGIGLIISDILLENYPQILIE